MVRLKLMSSGRGSTQNPPRHKRKPPPFARFVASYRRSHPDVPLEDLFERASEAYHRGGRNNPVKKRNPDSPVRYRGKRSQGRSEGRSTRRNPVNVGQVTRTAFGVQPTQMIAGAGTVLAVEYLGGLLDEKMNKGLAKPATENTVDLVYALRRTAPRGIVGAGAYAIAKAMDIPGAILQAIGIAASATTLMQFIGSARVAPQIVKDGSLLIGQHEPEPLWQLPPPSAFGKSQFVQNVENQGGVVVRGL